MGAIVNSGTGWSGSPSDGTGVIIGNTVYDPVTNTTTNTTSTTLADVDATNLAVTFVAPASGLVLVTLEAWAIAGSLSVLNWGLREGTTDIAAVSVQYTQESRVSCTFKITGLTPGSTHTYKWSHSRSTGSNTCATRYGQATLTGIDGGPANMLVTALGSTAGLAPAAPGQIIGYNEYIPGSNGNVVASGSASTLTAIDATNCTITFVAPASGIVLVELEGGVVMGANGNNGAWGLLEGASQVGGQNIVCTQNISLRAKSSHKISGLTPGSSHTYKWAYLTPGSTMTIFGGPGYGSLLMKAVAL